MTTWGRQTIADNMNTSHGSGRLTLSAALSRNTSLDSSLSSSVSQTKSASLAKAEREIKALKDENKKLRKDLEELRSLYDQLTTENSHEKFDERRITVLKSLTVQLERQVLLMSEALSSRSVTLSEVENALSWLADKWRYYIGLDVKGPEVGVQRSDLTQMVETAESARIKLYKSVENTATEKLSRPLMFLNDFLKPDKQEEITLFEIASGQIDHLNLKHVGKLESKLAVLYRELITLHDLMENGSYLTMSNHMSTMIRERTSTQLLKSCAMMKDCCADLMSMSLLYPSAPWPPLKRCCIKDLTSEKIMKNLPNLPRTKANEVHKVIEALLKAVNYRHYMVTQEVKSLKEDVKFHKSVYNLQISYIESLFNVVREGYINFEKSAYEIVVKPLKDILNAYEDLHTTASEGAFKEFLKIFKQNAEQLQGAVENLDIAESTSENGSEALSQYGHEFFKGLDKLVTQSQRARDKASMNKEDIRQQQEKLEEELRSILDEQEVKYQEHFVTDAVDNSNNENRTSNMNFNIDTEEEICVNIGNRKHQNKLVSSVDIHTNRSDKNCAGNDNHTDKNEKRYVDNENHTNRSDKKHVDNDMHTTRSQKRYEDNDIHKKYEEIDDDFICVKINERKPVKSLDSNRRADFIQSEVKSFNVNNESEMGISNNLQNDVRESKNLPTCETEGDNNVTDSLPPQGKKQTNRRVNKQKQERKYVPNTFVPNRTLHLRRSGSLSKLSDSSDQTVEDCEKNESQALPIIKRSNSALSIESEERSRSRKDSLDRGQGVRRSESKERRTNESGSVLRKSTVHRKPPFR